MSRTTYHRRADVLRAVIDEADLRRDGTLPGHLPGVDATFADDLDLIGALQLRWHARLDGILERGVACHPQDLEAACRAAWVATAQDLPGIRAILDHHLAHPSSAEMESALRKAVAKEHQLLAARAGLDSRIDQAVDTQAEAAGARIEAAARAAYRPAVPMPERGRSESEPGVRSASVRRQVRRIPAGSAAFVARIKAVLAA